ncbi:MAG: hypothetical protein LBF38_04265 [Deltaproteobacteria bacterium]|nr:hypothetical protein [Deltaproteobacteria bacterium]
MNIVIKPRTKPANADEDPKKVEASLEISAQNHVLPKNALLRLAAGKGNPSAQ